MIRLILHLILAGTSKTHCLQNKMNTGLFPPCLFFPDLFSNSILSLTCKSRSSISISKHKALCHSAAFSPIGMHEAQMAPRYKKNIDGWFVKCIQNTSRKNCIVQGHVQNTCEANPPISSNYGAQSTNLPDHPSFSLSVSTWFSALHPNNRLVSQIPNPIKNNHANHWVFHNISHFRI